MFGVVKADYRLARLDIICSSIDSHRVKTFKAMKSKAGRVHVQKSGCKRQSPS